jgi:hypothetical protein
MNGRAEKDEKKKSDNSKTTRHTSKAPKRPSTQQAVEVLARAVPAKSGKKVPSEGRQESQSYVFHDLKSG